MHTIKINGVPTSDEFKTLPEARAAAKAHNVEKPADEFAICIRGKTIEIWVHDVTFMAAGPDAWIAYSTADIDSIGAVRKAGSIYAAGNRGIEVGEFLTLGEAAVALNEHAKGPGYRAA